MLFPLYTLYKEEMSIVDRTYKAPSQKKPKQPQDSDASHTSKSTTKKSPKASTSIVDRTYKAESVKKQQNPPSISDRSHTKSVKQKSKKSPKSPKIPDAGYEVIDPSIAKSKKVEPAGGGYELLKKAPTTGYEMVGTPAGTGAGGYELVGKKSGARARKSEDQSMVVSSKDKKEPEKKKSLFLDFLYILAVIILVLFVLGLLGGLGFTLYHFSRPKPKELPDLSELCSMAEQKEDVGDPHCIYHKNKYPFDERCDETECEWLGLRMILTPSLKFDETLKHGEEPSKITQLPDNTPCAKGKWCQKGVCVNTTDELIKQYDEAPVVHGGWRYTGKTQVCAILTDDKNMEEKLNKLLEDCEDERTACSPKRRVPNTTRLLFKLGFRVCDNPNPSTGGDKCWTNGKDEKTNLVAEECRSCPGIEEKYVHNCSVSVKKSYGHLCRTPVLQLRGVCFYDTCIPFVEGSSSILKRDLILSMVLFNIYLLVVYL